MTSAPFMLDGDAGPSPRPGRLAYVVSRFPHLPETFILRELDQLDALGAEVVLCPLVRQRDAVVHPAAHRWVDRAVYTPFVSRRLVRDAGRLLRDDPRAGAHLAATLARTVGSPNFFAGTAGILLKVCHLARVLEERGVEHLHAHFATHPAMAAYLLHRLTGIPYSITVHAHDLYVDTVMLDRKLAAAAFVVTISDHNRRLLEPRAGGTPVHVVRSGVDLDRYPMRARTPDGPFTVLAVGSLQPYKGHRYLVDAVALLRDHDVDVRLQLIGGGELESRLRERIAAHRLEDRVELLGPRPEEEVAQRLGQAHVFALPSVVERSGKMEGLPVVLIEALAAGVPTVATALSGIPELVLHGETGRLVPPADPAALAAAIRWVHDHPEQAQTQAIAGRQLVEREHDLTTNVRRLAARFPQEAPR